MLCRPLSSTCGRPGPLGTPASPLGLWGEGGNSTENFFLFTDGGGGGGGRRFVYDGLLDYFNLRGRVQGGFGSLG